MQNSLSLPSSLSLPLSLSLSLSPSLSLPVPLSAPLPVPIFFFDDTYKIENKYILGRPTRKAYWIL